VPRLIKNTARFFAYLFVVGLLLSGCRVYPPPRLPALDRPPVTFGAPNDTTARAAAGDTTGIGDLSWKSFFDEPDLSNLIESVLRQNLDLRIAAQRIEQARANVLRSRGALVPSVDATAAVGVDRFGRYTMNGVGNFDTNLSGNVDGRRRIPNPVPDYFLGLRSSWEADLWGKLRARKRAAYLRLLASEEGRNLLVTGLVAEVARQYYSLLAFDAELEIIQENIRLQQRAVELVEVQQAAGRVTSLAVQQFTAQLLNTRSLEAQTLQRIVEAENELNQLLGRYPQPIVRRQTLRSRELPAEVSAGIPSQLLRRRPDIRQAERELQAANVDIDVARAEFMPSLVLTPYVGLNAFRASALFDPASLALGVLGGLTAPVFNRRILQANYAQSVARSQEAFLNYQQATLTGFNEVVTSLSALDNYRRVADLQKQEVTLLQRAVSTSNDLFANGYATYLEVITAQRSVLDAERALIEAKRTQFISLIDLYRALGGGWEQ
jgi:NodT family efflux transporter outer membrane factor (OMF) lipoprotein